ncbi:hypothetical protein HYT58_01985 [Candidatus Woesearchaeota archaeon]|nr:hypothetical protein [Candidatus Woesearchaeota archaeon]
MVPLEDIALGGRESEKNVSDALSEVSFGSSSEDKQELKKYFKRLNAIASSARYVGYLTTLLTSWYFNLEFYQRFERYSMAHHRMDTEPNFITFISMPDEGTIIRSHIIYPMLIGLCTALGSDLSLRLSLLKKLDFRTTFKMYKSAFQTKEDLSKAILEHAAVQDPLLKTLFLAEFEILNDRADLAFEKMKNVLEVAENFKIQRSLGSLLVTTHYWIDYRIDRLISNLFPATRKLTNIVSGEYPALFFLGLGAKRYAADALKFVGKKGLEHKILEAYGRHIMGYDSTREWSSVLSMIDPRKFRKVANSTYEVLEYPASNFRDLLIFKKGAKNEIKRGYLENLFLEDSLKKESARLKNDDMPPFKTARSIICLDYNGERYHINKRQPGLSLDQYGSLSLEQTNLALDGLAAIHSVGNSPAKKNNKDDLKLSRYDYNFELERRLLKRNPRLDKKFILDRLNKLAITELMQSEEEALCLNHGDPYLSNCISNGVWIDTRLCFRNPLLDVAGVLEDPRINGNCLPAWADSFKRYSGREIKTDIFELAAFFNNLCQLGSKTHQKNHEEAKFYLGKVLDQDSKLQIGIRDEIYMAFGSG